MSNWMNYVLEANAGLVFFYGIYFLLLRNETDFRKQRMFLLAGMVCALVSPVVHVDLIPAGAAIAPAVTNITVLLPEMVVSDGDAAFSREMLVGLTYLVVVILIAVPILVQCVRMYRVFTSSAGSYRGNYYVVESQNDNPSWSFFRLIFIGQSDKLSPDEKEMIVRHEMLHGKLLHSFDILLFTIVCLVFWFNPVVWMYRKTMARIHEFEVDAIVAAENNNSGYGLLLAKTALSANGFLLTHHFNQSFILKRIDMLNMLKRRLSNWKITVLVTTIVVYFVTVACTENESQETPVLGNSDTPANITAAFQKMKTDYPRRTFELKEVTDKGGFYKVPQEGKALVAMYNYPETGRAWIVTESLDRDQEVFVIAEENARPAGGITAFYERLSTRLIYPEQARKAGIEGKVFVEFTVMEDGHLTDFKVLKGIGAGCDYEAMKALTQMEAWEPGKMRGRAIRQKMVLPITFKLN